LWIVEVNSVAWVGLKKIVNLELEINLCSFKISQGFFGFGIAVIQT